jgi:hypothetical protein
MNFQPVQKQPQLLDSLKSSVQNLGQNINGIKDNVSNSFNQFSDSAKVGAGAISASFLNSNTIIAKIAFLILVLIVFLFLVNLGIVLISYFTTPTEDPYIFSGMIDGNNSAIIYQNPKLKDSVYINRSNNKNSGLEFTWNFWIYIDDLGNDSNKYQHVFNKGDNNFNSITGLSTVNNCPGVYIKPRENSLLVILDTVKEDDVNTRLQVDNLPIRKWVNVVVRVKNTIVDVYVNGVVSKRLILQNVPKQNFNDIFLCQNGGFAGKLSNLRYFSRALNVIEINNIMLSGPDLKITNMSELNRKYDKNYLSRQWYNQQM